MEIACEQTQSEPRTLTHRKALWRNPATLTGAVIALVSFLFLVSFLWLDMLAPTHNPYVGIWTFLVFPVFLVVGLLLMPAGVIGARWRRRRYGVAAAQADRLPHIDLNDATHRRIVVILVVGTLVLIPLIGTTSYRGYHYTDSTEFCGQVCHTVMEPQYTAYLQSPHARVSCAECHIGPGADWFVKSKLSGIRQVLAVATGSFPRPIPPAIQELRPATDTCRQCHWPSKFYGDQLLTRDHFYSDEENSHLQLRLLMKTGGSDPSTGPPSGIHWHMVLDFSIEYVATDEYLREIPWVRRTNLKTGEQTVYRSDGLPGDAPPPPGQHRTVDCMDCHNRPTHVFRAPDRAVDVALNVNPEFQSIPFAKRELVAALVEPCETKQAGLDAISTRIDRFYREQYPQVWSERADDIAALAQAGKDIFATNFFPEMNVNWRVYPDNIGHKITPGCFRCHEGKHVSDTGGTISRECSSCHDFLLPSEQGQVGSVVQTGGFYHPVELQGLHVDLRCDQCHTGGIAPARTCEGCHTDQAAFRAGTLAAFDSFAIQPDAMADMVDCESCHDLSEPMSIEAIDAACMDCHDDEEERFEGMVASWKAEADDLLNAADSIADAENQKLLELLRRAGPLHNLEATRKIVASFADRSSTAQAPGVTDSEGAGGAE